MGEIVLDPVPQTFIELILENWTLKTNEICSEIIIHWPNIKWDRG